MTKLLKYEFKSSRGMLVILITAVIITYISQSIIFAEQGNHESAGLLRIIAIPLFLGLLASEVVGFNNEVVNEKDRLIFHTPNTMWSIIGAKLIKTCIMVFSISMLISIFNILIGYVPLYGQMSDVVSFYAPNWTESLTLFSLIWNVTIVMVITSVVYFFIAVEAGMSSPWSVKIFIRFALAAALFFGLVSLMKVFMDVCPISIIINNSEQLTRGIAKEVNINSMSILPSGSGDDIKSLFFSDNSKIVLGVAPIIYNVVITLIFYPLTVLVLKKKVFS